MIGSLFARCRPRYINDYIGVLGEFYSNGAFDNPRVQLYLLETVKSLPRACSGDVLEQFAGFVIKRLDSPDSGLRLAALDAARSLVPGLSKHSNAFDRLMAVLSRDIQRSRLPAENYRGTGSPGCLNRVVRRRKNTAFCKEDLSGLRISF